MSIPLLALQNFGLQQKGTPDMFSMEGMFGDNGWFAPTLKGVQGLSDLYLGMKSFGLAKDQFRQSTDLLRTNLSNQANLTNAQLHDRQVSRYMMNPEQYQNPAAYMQQWGVSGTLGETGYQGTTPAAPNNSNDSLLKKPVNPADMSSFGAM